MLAALSKCQIIFAPVRPSSSWSIPGASTMGRGGTHQSPRACLIFAHPPKIICGTAHSRSDRSVLEITSRQSCRRALQFAGTCDPIRRKLYRSFTHNPTPEERKQGVLELEAKLRGFKYRGEPLPATLSLSDDKPVVDYFKQFPGLDAVSRFNNAGFWDLPIPVTRDIQCTPMTWSSMTQKAMRSCVNFFAQRSPSRAAHGVCHRHGVTPRRAPVTRISLTTSMCSSSGMPHLPPFLRT